MKTIENCPVTISNQGGVNLDGEQHDSLVAFWNWASHPVRAGRELFPSRPHHYVATTRNLAHYAINKATAMDCRSRGDVAAALIYEGICDRIYDRLPHYAQW